MQKYIGTHGNEINDHFNKNASLSRITAGKEKGKGRCPMCGFKLTVENRETCMISDLECHHVYHVICLEAMKSIRAESGITDG